MKQLRFKSQDTNQERKTWVWYVLDESTKRIHLMCVHHLLSGAMSYSRIKRCQSIPDDSKN